MWTQLLKQNVPGTHHLKCRQKGFAGLLICKSSGLIKYLPYAVATPLHKATSYEPRIAILGIWGETRLTRGKYGIYVAVCGSYGALTGSTWRLLPRKIYCRVSYVAVTRIPSLVLRNTWHCVIIPYSYGELPKFVLRCSYEAALRKGVTTALGRVTAQQ